MNGFRVWRADELVWGWSYCEAPRCMAAAVLLADASDDGRTGVPLCLECAGLLLERQAALSIGPATLAGRLPELWEEPPRARLRPSADVEPRTPEMWLAEQGYFGERVDTSKPDWDIPF